jgi:hypothetical protein
MAFSPESHIKVAIALNCEDHEAVPSFHYRLPCCMLSPTTHPSLNNAVLRMLMSRYTGPRNVSAGQESSSSSSWNTTWPARVGTDCAKGHDCRRPWHAQRRQDRGCHKREQLQHGQESSRRVRWKRPGSRGSGPERHDPLRAVLREHVSVSDCLLASE